MGKKFGISFGCLSPSINHQLLEQDIPFDPERIVKFDKAADAVAYLNVAGFLSDSEVRKARNRIMKAIQKEVSNAKT